MIAGLPSWDELDRWLRIASLLLDLEQVLQLVMLLMLDKLDLMLNRHQQLHSNWFLSYWIWISLWRWVWILIWLRCLNVRLNLYILMDHIHKQLLLVLLLGQRLDLLDKAKQLDNPLDLLVLHRLLN